MRSFRIGPSGLTGQLWTGAQNQGGGWEAGGQSWGTSWETGKRGPGPSWMPTRVMWTQVGQAQEHPPLGYGGDLESPMRCLNVLCGAGGVLKLVQEAQRALQKREKAPRFDFSFR